MKPIQYIALIALFAGAINMQAMQQKVTLNFSDGQSMVLDKGTLLTFKTFKDCLDGANDNSDSNRSIQIDKMVSKYDFEYTLQIFNAYKKDMYGNNTDRTISDMTIKDRERKINAELVKSAGYPEDITFERFFPVLTTASHLVQPESMIYAANKFALLLDHTKHLEALSNNDDRLIKKFSEDKATLIAQLISPWAKGFIIKNDAANTTNNEPMLNKIISPDRSKKITITPTKMNDYYTTSITCADANTEKRLFNFDDVKGRPQGDCVVALRFSPDNKQLAFMNTPDKNYYNNKVSMHNADTGKQLWEKHVNFPRALEYASDNKRILVLNDHEGMHLLTLDAQTGNQLNNIALFGDHDAFKNTQFPTIAAATIMRKNTLLACYSKAINIIDIDEDRLVDRMAFNENITFVQLFPDGKHIVVHFKDGKSMTITKIPGNTLEQRLLIRILALRKDTLSKLPLLFAQEALPLKIKNFPWITQVLASYSAADLKELKAVFPIDE